MRLTSSPVNGAYLARHAQKSSASLLKESTPVDCPGALITDAHKIATPTIASLRIAPSLVEHHEREKENRSDGEPQARKRNALRRIGRAEFAQ